MFFEVLCPTNDLIWMHRSKEHQKTMFPSRNTFGQFKLLIEKNTIFHMYVNPQKFGFLHEFVQTRCFLNERYVFSIWELLGKPKKHMFWNFIWNRIVWHYLKYGVRQYMWGVGSLARSWRFWPMNRFGRSKSSDSIIATSRCLASQQTRLILQFRDRFIKHGSADFGVCLQFRPVFA
jgi:hypothetical protein